MHLPDYVYYVSFQGYRPSKLPLSCEVVKKVVFGPPICMEGIPQILHMHLQIGLTSERVINFC